MSKAQERYDSDGLVKTFAAIANKNTGLGTNRDKGASGVLINAPAILTESELNYLFRTSGLIRNIVTTYPKDCHREWMKISNIEPDMADALRLYLTDLSQKIGRISAKKAFKEASIKGRHYGDGYIFIGLADGLDPSQPVNLKLIRSVEWLRVFDRFEVYPDFDLQGDRRHPEFYRVFGSKIAGRWHHSRVLRFPGNELFDDRNTNNGHNDSVIQTMMSSWSSWYQSHLASSAMVQDYSQAIFRMNGLARLLTQDKQKGTDENAQWIAKRLSVADIGRSVAKMLVIDADDEDFEYVNRSYAGVKDIVQDQKDALISDLDMPGFKVFNTSNSTGNSLGSASTAAMIQEFQWMEYRDNWVADNWTEPYTQLLKYAIAAQDNSIPPDTTFKVEPNGQVTMTPLQNAEIISTQADTHERMNGMNVYGPATIKQNLRNPSPDGRIILAEEDLK